jgi:uncharacterized protein YabE (DUF348 family)
MLINKEDRTMRNGVRVNVESGQAVYVNIGGKVFYIDTGMGQDQTIVRSWNEKDITDHNVVQYSSDQPVQPKVEKEIIDSDYADFQLEDDLVQSIDEDNDIPF